MMRDTLFYRFGETQGVGRIKGRTVALRATVDGRVEEEDYTLLSRDQIARRTAQWGPYRGLARVSDGVFETLDEQAPFSLTWHSRAASWTCKTHWGASSSVSFDHVLTDMSRTLGDNAFVSATAINATIAQALISAGAEDDAEQVRITLDSGPAQEVRVMLVGYGQPSTVAVHTLGWLAKQLKNAAELGGENAGDSVFARYADDETLTVSQLSSKPLAFIGAALQDGTMQQLAVDIGLAPDNRITMPTAKLPSINF